MRFQDAFDEFMLEKSLDTREATQKHYRWRIAKMAKETAVTTLDELTPTTLLRWLLSLKQLAPATQYSYRRDVSTFTRWCQRRGYVKSDPMAALPKARKPRRERPAYFSPEQVQNIVREARKGYHAKRELALVFLLLDTGIRAGEAANLTLEDIDWKGRTLVVDGKTGQREVPITGMALTALKRYIRSYRRAPSSERHVFTTREGQPLASERVTLVLNRLAKRAGVDGVKTGPHTYRHTFAVNYIQAGGDAFSLQRILGHTTMETTAIYVYMNSEDLKLTHAKFSPLRRLL